MTAIQIYWTIAGGYFAFYLLILFGLRPLIAKVSCRHGLWWFICKECKK